MSGAPPTFLTSPRLDVAGVRHAFFTRQGGVSSGIYASLNLGRGSRDDPAAVLENQARAAAALGLEADSLAIAYQVHSARVHVAEQVVCAVHAGWRGALGGVIEAGVAVMTGLGASPGRIVAAVGPCIGPQSYEVGEDFRRTFLDADPDSASRFHATDNFPTRFVINQICHEQKKPLIFAAVNGFLGQVSTFKSYENSNPCYACFNPNIVGADFSLPLSEKGILGSVAGTTGALQATTTIKEVLGIGESLVGKILIFDFLKNEFRKTTLKKNPNCKVCSK